MTEETKKPYPDWFQHATDAKLALVINMTDEEQVVAATIGRVVPRFDWIGIVRTTNSETPFAFLGDSQVEYQEAVPSLEEQYSPGEAAVRTICRGYAMLFSAVREVRTVDYIVAIQGSTLLLHPFGIEQIVADMQERSALVGCAKALGQEFNKAEWTEEELQAGKGGGRVQDKTMLDIQPNLFVVNRGILDFGALCDIQIINRWCPHENLGAATQGATQYAYSEQPFMATDGILFNVTPRAQA